MDRGDVGQQDDEKGRDCVPDFLSSHRHSFGVVLGPIDPDAMQNDLMKICLQVDDAFYPSHDWRDLAVVIVRWWIDAFLAQAQGESVRNHFMNGPFSFITTLTGLNLKLEFVRTGLHTDDVLTWDIISVSDYRTAMSTAASALVDKFESADADSDLTKLRHSLRLLVG